MLILQSIYQLVFYPLELLFEYIFGIAESIIGNPGSAIVVLSLCMNFLALPFYNRADSIQKEEREREAQLAPGVSHIKKVFKSDERYMMLQAFYRVNKYKPIYALRSSLPLLLEIPFFVAAYHFLSNLPELNGAAYGILTNLGEPDHLLSIGNVQINVLPILMTLINVISSTIYAKKLTLKDKIQMYGIAVVFLVLLYNSPSGLVFYWTLNNLFSLCKNLVYSIENRKFIICSIMSGMGVIFLAFSFAVYRTFDLNQLLVIIIGIACQIPTIKAIADKKTKQNKNKNRIDLGKSSALLFFLGCLFLTVLTGLMIPSAVIRSSPAEFVVASEYQSPLLYILNSFLLSTGTFIIWIGLFYYLANERFRQIMCVAIWIISFVSIADYMFFGTKLGNMSSEMKYDIAFHFSPKEIMINIEMIIFAIGLLLIVWVKKRKIVHALFPVLIIAVLGISLYNVFGIVSILPKINTILEQADDEKASFSLNRNGKNVIVLMLDRAISGYVPYLFQEKPELKRQFEGFTWYPNTLSYGTRTNTGSPALFGGYEYTPEELNKRDTEYLVDKQNEALKVMPVLFDREGYEVTVCDPPYAGYTWIPDLSIFDDYPDIKTYNTENGQFVFQVYSLEDKQQIWNRNLYCFSIMKISPLIIQEGLYDKGNYYNPLQKNTLIRQTHYLNKGKDTVAPLDSFTESYAVLCALPDITKISDQSKNTFLMMQNSTPHNTEILQEPQYEPGFDIDNSIYDASHNDRFVYNGRVMDVDSLYQLGHYHTNMAAFIKLGEWFDYMREEGVYDNTRIIIVADHGWPLEQFKDMIFSDERSGGTVYNPEDAMAYNPLLLVKDFNSHEFRVDD